MRFTKKDNGFTLIELIIVIAVIALLLGIIGPMLIGFMARTQQTMVEAEASQFLKGAKVAYVQAVTTGHKPKQDAVHWKVNTSKSPFYKNGTLYGNVTNWTVKNGVVAGNSNVYFIEAFMNTMGIVYGTGWDKGGSVVPFSDKEPKISEGGSMDEKCIFQLFYDDKGVICLEYSRNGYFVRMEGSAIVETIKLKKETDASFTKFIKVTQ